MSQYRLPCRRRSGGRPCCCLLSGQGATTRGAQTSRSFNTHTLHRALVPTKPLSLKQACRQCFKDLGHSTPRLTRRSQKKSPCSKKPSAQQRHRLGSRYHNTKQAKQHRGLTRPAKNTCRMPHSGRHRATTPPLPLLLTPNKKPPRLPKPKPKIGAAGESPADETHALGAQKTLPANPEPRAHARVKSSQKSTPCSNPRAPRERPNETNTQPASTPRPVEGRRMP